MERIRIRKPKPRRRGHDDAQTGTGVGLDQTARDHSNLARELDELLHDIDLVLEPTRRREV